MDDKAYFSLYEDRYRRLHDQGVDDWISNPQELARTFTHIDEFLKYAKCRPSETSIIELGCGQGHLAEYLIENGYKYSGVDISESAVAHARNKVGRQKAFIVADITDLKNIKKNTFDVALDNQCFHMLITDEHRRKYLAELNRILKNNGKLFFQENFQKEEFTDAITSLKQFDGIFHGDHHTLRKYWAFTDGDTREIKLPMIPARANNEAGYRKELISAGFTVDYFKVEIGLCTIYAHKKGVRKEHQMDKYLQNNKSLWNELTPIHAQSAFYDVEGFKEGKCTLKPIELDEVGDVSGKSLLHLQCHFGMDTLSWGQRGAKVTGVDFSEESIKLARSLSKETGLKARFIHADIYDLPEVLKGRFDIVFTSYGVLAWLPDLKKWAETIAHFLKRGGFFYVIEAHPTMLLLDDSEGAQKFSLYYPYFFDGKPRRFDRITDYADRTKSVRHGSYEWPYPLGAVVTSLAEAGLRIEFLHEVPVSSYQSLPYMKKQTDGFWHIEGDKLPLMFSLKAVKP